jgi:hypothetical protein
LKTFADKGLIGAIGELPNMIFLLLALILGRSDEFLPDCRWDL